MSTSSSTGGRKIVGLSQLQRLGRSLMLPIAALPAAGLLLRLGQDDLLGSIAALKNVAIVLAAAGNALFDNLPILFAVGVAIGFAKKADGSTALAAVVGYVTFTGITKALSPVILKGLTNPDGKTQLLIDYKVLGGLITGLVAAWLWQRYHRLSLPPYLAFFGGRRFVPIITSLAMMVIAVVLSVIYPWFNSGLDWVGHNVTSAPVIGAGIYGILNRLLIPLGLHHILNSFLWFVFGKATDANGNVVTGDINRFVKAHDPSAGIFQTGFFPIFMFALPAAALAIYHTAKPAQKRIVGGLMLSAGLTSFITGVTEPLEFTFMFVAWPLYVVHAVLTGTSHAIVNALGIHDGFFFSAGAIDYILNFNIATKPLWLIPIGLIYAAIYYFLFRWVITKWNLRTPGREEDTDTTEQVSADQAPAEAKVEATTVEGKA
ncbi:PTS N-acetylglucosamine transporter subunit IIBC [Pseudonocardiaceae bacterium YIM PH 21723]|nr:PTS N-acetylglucosamine transporter subunit IIBC [Pseudonocardiaceae bacterium YIM PH 21723]